MGGDCSVNMSAGPRVSSLANFGLCDVRTKPCRDVVVLTDHLADDPSLHCVFEVYKVTFHFFIVAKNQIEIIESNPKIFV